MTTDITKIENTPSSDISAFAEINFDYVEAIYSFLTFAAMRKQVVMFDMVCAVCRGEDKYQVIRGYFVNKYKATSEEYDAINKAINHIAKSLQVRNRAPLTVLITSDGRTTAQGFWKGTFLEEHMENAALLKKYSSELRRNCYREVDIFSSLNTGLNAYLTKADKAIANSVTKFPYLHEATTSIWRDIVDGSARPTTLSYRAKMISENVTFDETMTNVVDYNKEVLISNEERNTHTEIITLPLDDITHDMSSKLALRFPGKAPLFIKHAVIKGFITGDFKTVSTDNLDFVNALEGSPTGKIRHLSKVLGGSDNRITVSVDTHKLTFTGNISPTNTEGETYHALLEVTYVTNDV